MTFLKNNDIELLKKFKNDYGAKRYYIISYKNVPIEIPNEWLNQSKFELLYNQMLEHLDNWHHFKQFLIKHAFFNTEYKEHYNWVFSGKYIRVVKELYLQIKKRVNNNINFKFYFNLIPYIIILDFHK